MVLRVLLVLAGLAALAGTGKAESIIVDTFSYLAVYYGSAELFSSGGTLLSTTLAMTVETQPACAGVPQADQNACGTAIGQAAQGISGPPLPPVFVQDFQNQLASFENTNGLGNASPDSATPTQFDPNSAPTPTSDALYTDLTAQAGNFTVTSDTGFVEYGNPLDYVFVWEVTDLPVPAEAVENGQQACCITTIEGGVAVQFFERDLQLTEAATPEPSALPVAGLACAVLGLWRVSRIRA